jgi:electron transport complex protein RnfG
MAKESSFKNMALTLFVITFVSSAVLAGVYELTKDAIEAVRIRKVNQGISEVLPSSLFDNDPSQAVYRKYVDGDTVYVYVATMKGDTVGAAVQTFTNNGYGGRFVLLVGFSADTITSINVISHSETPGLGDKISPQKSDFSLQFHGKNPETSKLKVRKEGGDVDAITASTISSKAFCEAVDRAYSVYRQDIMRKEWDGGTGATSNTN